jgi:HD-like signal output (HDOD) protein
MNIDSTIEREQDSVSCSEVAADDLPIDNQLYFQIYEDYREGRLQVPTVPDLAARIRRVINDPLVNANAIAKIVQTDPSLSAYLIRVANSPLYNVGRKVQDLPAAITRLGFTVSRDLITSFMLKNLFTSDKPQLKKRMTTLWLHNCAVSAFSFVIARETRVASPDRALLAGLLHDVGDAVILTHAEKYPALINEPAMLDEVLAKLRGQIGAMVLTHWNMDEDLIDAAAGAEDWYREKGGKADICDIVIVAQLMLQQSEDDGRYLPAAEKVPAYSKLSAGKTLDEFASSIVDGARDELRDIQKLLNN